MKTPLAVTLGLALVVFVHAGSALAAGKPEAKKKVAAPNVAETEVTLKTILMDGKKTWTPKDVKAPSGNVKFVLTNTLAEPHGFDVRAGDKSLLKQPVVVGPGATTGVTVNLTAGSYELKCHMHPAHVSSHLVVF